MRRSASESSSCDVPPWGMQVPPPQAGLKAATGMLVGPLKVELLVVTKSVWNFHRLSELVAKLRK